jgi:hypothetical protein
MKSSTDLESYLPRLVQQFDEGIHSSPTDASTRGWGQFLSPESHQIGLYGTCSGILVTTIGSPSAPIDSGAVNYLVSSWNQRGIQTQRYFNQTLRLAYFVLSLARVQVPALLTIRNQAVAELTERQRPDGGWGDWANAPPRMETTAWAVLALARLPDDLSAAMTAKKGAIFLQQRVLGFKDFVDSIDPFILAVILHTSPPELSARIRSGALRQLSTVRPSDELQVYFVDFVVGSGDASEMHRDYICVPRFFGFCLLASVPIELRSPFASIRFAISHRRAIAHLDRILAGGLLRTSASRFPSTVDQAFVALSVEYTVSCQPRFSGVISWARPWYLFLHRNFVFRIAIPLLLLSFLATLAHEPKDFVGLTFWLFRDNSELILEFTERHDALIRFTSILLGFVLGKPLIDSVWRFVRERWID